MNAKRYPFLGAMTVTLQYGVKGESWKCGFHDGIDLVCSNKTVVAVDDGTVVSAKYSGAYGNVVFLSHSDGTGTLYAHLASISSAVKAGGAVAKGQALGVMGATGNVTGPHLHFESHNATTFQYAKDLIDPNIYLNFPTSGGEKSIPTYDEANAGYTTAQTETQTDSSGGLASQMTSAGFNSYFYTGDIYKVTGKKESSEVLYGRRYRVFVDTGKGKAFEVSDLRCTFQILKTSFLEPNQSIVTIYNLSPATENALIKEGQKIILEAGYEGDQYGQIFIGSILQPIRYKEDGTTYCLMLVSMDSDRYLAYGFVGSSMVAGQTARDVIDTCASRASIPTDIGFISEGIGKNKLPRGKVLFGMARDYLRQIAKSENSTYYMNNGKINIIQAAQYPKGEIIDLSPDSGLVGLPEQTEYGMKCRMLLNPRVDIGSLIHLDNELIRGMRYNTGQVIRALDEDGIYRVIKLTITGDTRGNDWYTDVETVAQAGLLPDMIAGEALYLN